MYLLALSLLLPLLAEAMACVRVCAGEASVCGRTHPARRALAETGAVQRDADAAVHEHASSVLRELGRAGMSGEAVRERERAGRPRAALWGNRAPLCNPVVNLFFSLPAP